jgi:hypothetical protein
VLVSAFALIPTDIAALAYQLADFKIMARRAGRFLALTLFSFGLTSFDAMPVAGALVRTKHLPTILQSALIERRRIGNKNASPSRRRRSTSSISQRDRIERLY